MRGALAALDSSKRISFDSSYPCDLAVKMALHDGTPEGHSIFDKLSVFVQMLGMEIALVKKVKLLE